MIFDHALAELLDLGAFRPISRHPSESDLCLLGAGYLRQKVLLFRSLEIRRHCHAGNHNYSQRGRPNYVGVPLHHLVLH
jgi:hypothetical protein